MKFNFDKYIDKPDLWDDVFKNLSENGEDPVIEMTTMMDSSLKECADKYQIPVVYLDGTFLYDPKKNETVCMKGTILAATVQFFYQKAVQNKRQLSVVHLDGRVDNYYFGSQEDSDIQDLDYPKTKQFCDRSGIRFVVNNSDDLVGVIFQAEPEILDAEWKNFDLLNTLQMGKITRRKYQIIGTRE